MFYIVISLRIYLFVRRDERKRPAREDCQEWVGWESALEFKAGKGKEDTRERRGMSVLTAYVVPRRA